MNKNEEDDIESVYDPKIGAYILRKNGKPIGISLHPPATKEPIFYNRNDVEKMLDVNTHMCNFNSLLRGIRKSKKIKQIEIAKNTGLSKQMVSKMESVDGNPTLDSLLKYCFGIGVDLEEALEKQIPKKPNMRHIKIFDGYNDGWCPCCGSYVQEVEYDKKYCQECGQALDWGE